MFVWKSAAKGWTERGSLVCDHSGGRCVKRVSRARERDKVCALPVAQPIRKLGSTLRSPSFAPSHVSGPWHRCFTTEFVSNRPQPSHASTARNHPDGPFRPRLQHLAMVFDTSVSLPGGNPGTQIMKLNGCKSPNPTRSDEGVHPISS